jgi:phosphoglucosamine mutase
MDRYPQKLVNVAVSQRRPMEDFPELVKLRESLQKRLGGDGRLVIRPSGTEPVIRVMVEGADHQLIEETVEEMAASIRKFMA